MSDKCCRVPQLVAWYRQFLDDGQSAAFVRAVTVRYSTACLQRLTQSSGIEERRAAVLALGMVAGKESIPAVGRCLRDADRCVRLVAEVAFMDLTRRELGTLPAQLLDKAKRHVDGGRYEDALHLLSSMLEVWPAFGDAWYQRGIAFYCLNRFSEAIRDAEHAVRVNEFHFAAYALRGRSYLELERPLVALKNFKKSCEVNPSQVLVRGYIDVLQKQNRRLNHDDSTS